MTTELRPLNAREAFRIVQEWAAAKKPREKDRWGVIWDPLAREGVRGFEGGGPCQVVHNHNGASYDVKAWGKTWAAALKAARIPVPGVVIP